MELMKISEDRAWNIALNALAHPEASEITVNGPDSWFINIGGKRTPISGIPEMNERSYMDSIKRGLVNLVVDNQEFEEEGYLYEGRLEVRHERAVYNGRCHIVLKPAADTPQVSIAKQSTSHTNLEKIAATGSMSIEMLTFLTAAVKAELTTVVSGGTGAGKTTLVRSLADLIPLDERVGIAEDTPEIVLKHKNATYLHSMPWKPGFDPNSVATLSWVVQQFNRMRIDKVIIGETRGKEFADFLVAANSGMEGSITTIHANSPELALKKMSKFAIAGSPGESQLSINGDISRTIDLIVQIRKFRNGARKIVKIQEITGTISPKTNEIATQTLYEYDEKQRKFRKVSNPTDSLRNRFFDYGVKETLFNTQIGSLQDPYFAKEKSNTQGSTNTGTPIGQGNPFSTKRSI